MKCLKFWTSSVLRNSFEKVEKIFLEVTIDEIFAYSAQAQMFKQQITTANNNSFWRWNQHRAFRVKISLTFPLLGYPVEYFVWKFHIKINWMDTWFKRQIIFEMPHLPKTSFFPDFNIEFEPILQR